MDRETEKANLRGQAVEETMNLRAGNPVTMGGFERASAAGWKAPLPDYAERVRQGAMAGQAVAVDTCCVEAKPPSMAEEAYKRAQDHAEIAEKAIHAADFLRKHPEFEEFIRLIRKGSIQI